MLITDDWIKDRLEERRFGALSAGLLKTEAKAAEYAWVLLLQVCDADPTA